MLYRQDKPNLKDTGVSNHKACIEIRVRIQICMRDSVGVWPQGLEVVAEGFESLEDELYFAISQQGTVSTEYINWFLQTKFEMEDVTIQKRSFMRYLRKDMRFKFDGSPRKRVVSAVDLEEYEKNKGWGEIATSIIDYLIELTMDEYGDGMDAHVSLEKICEYFEKQRGHPFLGFTKDAMDKALDTLMIERRIEPLHKVGIRSEGYYSKELEICWGPASYIGFSLGGKTSGGLHLSSRTWNTAKEICAELNAISKQAKLDYLEGMRNGVSMNVALGFATDNPVLKLALSRGSLTATDVVDVAIEVLKSTIGR